MENSEKSAYAASGARKEPPLCPLADRLVPGALFQAANNLEREYRYSKKMSFNVRFCIVSIVFIINVRLSRKHVHFLNM